MLVATTKGRLPQRSWSWISLQLRSSTFSEDGLRGCPRMQSIARVRTASRLWSSPLFCGAEPLGSTKPPQSTLNRERKSNSADLTTATLRPWAPSIQHALDSAIHLMGRVVADFVPGYFLRGDTTFLQTQLRRVRLCLWFWDPDLAVRLFDELEIPPAMFAVPWFITLFADVWPIDRVAYVWDALFSVGPPLLTFLAVAVLRAKREDLMRVGVGIDPATGEEYCSPETGAGAFSTCMQIFSRLNAGERGEMPNVRWCVLKALSMYAQMPRSVVAEELEHDYADVASSSRIFVGGSEVEGGGNENRVPGTEARRT